MIAGKEVSLGLEGCGWVYTRAVPDAQLFTGSGKYLRQPERENSPVEVASIVHSDPSAWQVEYGQVCMKLIKGPGPWAGIGRVCGVSEPMILPGMRMDHEIHNETHFKNFINREKGWGECTGLFERIMVGGCQTGVSTF